MENHQKIFFFDIDGTLAIRGKTTPGNMEALRRLKEAGCLTFICTGRPPFYAKKLYGDLVSGIVCCNGRVVLYQDEVIFRQPLSGEEMEYMIHRFEKLDLGYMFYAKENYLLVNAPERIEAHMVDSYGTERMQREPEDMDYYSMDIFYQGTEQRDTAIENLKDILVLNDHGGSGSADCSTKDFDKGTAVAHVLKYFGIPKEEAYAFGDGSNDVAMFRAVGKGIAMGNGVEELKAIAYKVTDTIHNEGITKALEEEGILEA